MKKLLTGFIFSLLAFAIWINPSFAQSDEPQIVKTMMVATVNIYDATNKKINNNTYDISFRIKNKTGIQPDIRYGIQLVRKSDGKVMDMDLANQAITLGEGESKNINLKYTIPSFIPEGIYRILIVSQNSSGMLLSISPIGFPEKLITIDGSGNGVNINNCYLTVPTDATSTKYTVDQGVDILPTESINATCEISNNSVMGNGDLRLQLITHERDQYGNILDSQILDQKFSLRGNGKDTITFQVPTQTKPQAYDIDIFFINSSGEKISPSLYLNYVVNGNSATIQNTFLDKTSYQEGETASIEVFWAPAAGTFSMSRLGNVDNQYVLNAKITDGNGNICGEARKELTAEYYLNDAIINIPITINCENVAAVVEITDSEGNVLASQSIDINNPANEVNINANVPNANTGGVGLNKFYVVLFVVVLVLIGYGILVFRKENKK